VHWLLYSQRRCPTHEHYTGSIPQLWSTTRGIQESISHCVVYKTVTNIWCFAAGRPQQLISRSGIRRLHRDLFLSWDVSWNYLWKHDLRWNVFCKHGPMHSKMFIILINLCVKFSYYILVQKKCISLNPVKAVLTIIFNNNSILLTASTNCKNQMTTCLERLVATA